MIMPSGEINSLFGMGALCVGSANKDEKCLEWRLLGFKAVPRQRREFKIHRYT